MHVAIQECRDVFRRGRNFVFLQNANDDSGIGHAGDLDVIKLVVDLEAFLECALQRFHSSAAGMNERAVDIEKKKTFLHSSTDYADFCGWWKKSGRVHEKHADHAREECQRGDPGDAEHD